MKSAFILCLISICCFGQLPPNSIHIQGDIYGNKNPKKSDSISFIPFFKDTTVYSKKFNFKFK